MYFLSETMALQLPEPQCPLSMASMIYENTTEVPQITDSDPTSCLTFGENVGQWVQISFPYIRMKGQFYVSLMGNLKCSPTFGLGVAVVGDCESGTCSYSRCVASDLTASDGMGGCTYRCHSFNMCNHIIVDIADLSSFTRTGALCEIVL